MASQIDKKKRSANYSEAEVTLLCELVFKYAETIESKKTDALSWREKNEAWEKLMAEFNFKSGGPVRTSLNLRTKYETIKKELRKKCAKNKEERDKTGGGVSNITPLAPHEELIYTIITLSIEGMPRRYDDFAGGNSSQGQEPEQEPHISETNNPEFEESHETETIFIEFNDDLTDVELIPPAKKSRIDFSGPEYTCARSVSPDMSQSFLTFGRVKEKGMGQQEPSSKSKSVNTEKETCTGVSPTFIQKKWNPTRLKQPASKELNVKKKNALTKLEASEKVGILSEAKKKLIDIQINYYEKELDLKDKENRLKLLKAEEELKNIKLEGKVKELEIRIKEETLNRIITKPMHDLF